MRKNGPKNERWHFLHAFFGDWGIFRLRAVLSRAALSVFAGQGVLELFCVYVCVFYHALPRFTGRLVESVERPLGFGYKEVFLQPKCTLSDRGRVTFGKVAPAMELESQQQLG